MCNYLKCNQLSPPRIMALITRARRKKAFVTGCLTSVILLCILSDRREDHNLKQYQYFDGQFSSVRVVKQNET